MICCPAPVTDFCFLDFLEKFPFDFNRHCQPLSPIGRFDFVAVPPIASGILHIIIQHYFVNGSHGVKKTFPWNVVRLSYYQLFAHIISP